MSRSLCFWLLTGLIAFPAGATVAEPFAFAESPAFEVNTAIQRLDGDSDGLPDGYERSVGLNPAVADSAEDPDGDGLSNLQEYNSGTNPLSPDSRYFASAESSIFVVNTGEVRLDSDGDRLPDAWELAHGLDTSRNDANEDLDGDGLSNIQEYNAGTDPRSQDFGESAGVSTLFAVNTAVYPFVLSRDTDSDGIPDWWEEAHGLSAFVDDAAADPDGDGVTNIAEYRQGGDPRRNELAVEIVGTSGLFTLNTIFAPPDTDGDGIRDCWELAYGLDVQRNDSQEDPDGDGRTNLEEYNAGTDPRINDWAGPSFAASAVFTADTGGLLTARDSDGDGMPDWWEALHGLDPNRNDALDDYDRDGVANYNEFTAGTDPTRFDPNQPVLGISNIFLVDTGGRSFDADGDGLPDWWERLYYNDLRIAMPSEDTDGDGVSNYREFLTGSSPLDPSSLLRINQIAAEETADGKMVTLRWVSFSGRTYSIWGATIPTGPYLILMTNVAATPPLNTGAIRVTGDTAFFRVGSAQ